MSNAMSRRNLRISAAANTNEFSSIFSDGGCHVFNSDSKEVKLPEEFSVIYPLGKAPQQKKRCSKTIKPDLQKKHEWDELEKYPDGQIFKVCTSSSSSLH